MPAKLTLGAEEEFHLVDLKTWRLCPRAPQVLSQLPEEFFKAELQRSTIETNTEVVDTLAGLRAELLNKRQQLIRAAASVGAGVAATGTAPRSDFNDFEMTANGRFAKSKQFLGFIHLFQLGLSNGSKDAIPIRTITLRHLFSSLSLL